MSSLKEFANLLKKAQKESKALNDFSKMLKDPKSKKITEEEHPIEQSVIFSENISVIYEKTSEAVSPIEKVAMSLPSKKLSENIETERWNDPIKRNTNERFVTFKELNDHYTGFLNRIQQQLASLGGGGEVRLQRLDDVNYLTIADDRFLQYDQPSKKFILVKLDDDYTTQINENNTLSVINLPNVAVGPIQGIKFDTTHEHEGEEVGTLCWNPSDDTLNIQHSNGVVQQVGQELYAFVRNRTANTITDGTVVRFDGAEENGTARLLIAPFLADGSFPSLYGLGIATNDIEPGEDGKVTVWGKVRDLDTSAWNVGDILYVSPSVPGGLTNIKPTAPNNVIPMAAVLKKDATTGEIFVRPTIEQKMNYGRFERTTDLAVAATNTAYVITFDTTEISNGVERVSGNISRLQVNQSGLYQIDVSAQVDATGGGFSSGTMYMWIRKNGVDAPDSTRRQGVLGSAPSTNIAFSVVISLNANDYVEIAYAGDSTSLSFDAAGATAFAPSTAAVKVGVTQIQL